MHLGELVSLPVTVRHSKAEVIKVAWGPEFSPLAVTLLLLCLPVPHCCCPLPLPSTGQTWPREPPLSRMPLSSSPEPYLLHGMSGQQDRKAVSSPELTLRAGTQDPGIFLSR